MTRLLAVVKHLNGALEKATRPLSDDPGRGDSEIAAVDPVNIRRVEPLILENRWISCHRSSFGTVHTIGYDVTWLTHMGFGSTSSHCIKSLQIMNEFNDSFLWVWSHPE